MEYSRGISSLKSPRRYQKTISVTIYITIPTIFAVSHIRYICGLRKNSGENQVTKVRGIFCSTEQSSLSCRVLSLA
ncbi:hypothetical protein BDV32DRAFT_124332 [Aspergillus pseudonomiae]|nr:hypothetical protein BDV32DRAFT_124332 [Aspergillus pseudonomiae]